MSINNVIHRIGFDVQQWLVVGNIDNYLCSSIDIKCSNVEVKCSNS